jgi:hypothetical protein
LRIITPNEIIKASTMYSSSLPLLTHVLAVHRLFASSVSAACSSTTQGLHDFFDQTSNTREGRRHRARSVQHPAVHQYQRGEWRCNIVACPNELHPSRFAVHRRKVLRFAAASAIRLRIVVPRLDAIRSAGYQFRLAISIDIGKLNRGVVLRLIPMRTVA